MTIGRIDWRPFDATIIGFKRALRQSRKSTIVSDSRHAGLRKLRCAARIDFTISFHMNNLRLCLRALP
jgi:hypothetical protein